MHVCNSSFASKEVLCMDSPLSDYIVNANIQAGGAQEKLLYLVIILSAYVLGNRWENKARGTCQE